MASTTGVLPAGFRLFSLTGVALSFGSFFALATFYFLYSLVYNVFFHPLKHIPGPLLARACGIPYSLRMRNGSINAWIKSQHDQYGDAVRLAPGEVSFISGETAWPDIYGFRIGRHKNTGHYLKDKNWYALPVNGVRSLISADTERHSCMRRNLSHAFSDRALRQQEPLIQSYVDLLVQRIGEHAAEGKDMDITQWYNYTTFDVIADLAFGEPLYCLRDSTHHIWISMVITSVKAAAFSIIQRKYPLFHYYDKLCNLGKDNTTMQQTRIEFSQKAHEKVERRLEKVGKEDEKTDFFSFIVKNQENEAKKLTREEMTTNAVLFLIAGSETTATTLSGATYLLLKNPDAYTKLVQEIRSTFTSLADITIEGVNKMNYMIACLQEGLRYYPPVPTGFPRVVPKGGDHISGHYIPEGTSVYMSQYAANHSTRNYKDPEAYVPERWLGDERYKDDNKDIFNPFSFGPRNCLGKNLALAEMRLVLAKLLFKFDLELVDKEKDWFGEQKLFTLWEKGPLMVRFTPVQQ
ncbi:cytochrome P450 monooxygenase-like protein [Clathrospora elynae]|uniref:Cytochrome P450 monooxygenase-like protein n=1 Tax=Clathrospora elynae TaxID=706981 RepID=A0A6A5SPX8_9PLEO|nr:cytochrome P450 monooxygenase-like protein [Clathrospora elynae]